MTLAQRNRYFKAGIVLSAACLAGIVFFASKLLPLYPGLAGLAAKRVSGLFQGFGAWFFPPAPLVPFVSVLASILFALAASILIYVFFEKTQSPEVLFFGLWTLSFVFEFMRLGLPLYGFYSFPGLFLIIGARILCFGRLLGALSFFAASIYAAGFELQKQGTMVFAITIAALAVSLGIPVDLLSWDSGFVMISGYGSLFRRAETGIVLISALTFFVAFYVRGTNEYLGIAIAALFASLGRDLVINADAWALFVPGFIMLSLGSWFAGMRLRQVYLWL